jgi:nitrogen fixation NifU-like protein
MTMTKLASLYREVVLDHHRDPRGAHPLERVDAESHGTNPVCGDDVTVQLALDGERIEDVGVCSQGCAISVASGSMLAELLVGRSQAEAERIAHALQRLLRGESERLRLDASAGAEHERDLGSLSAMDADLGDLEALAGVRQFPARIKCAALPWVTLLDALGARQRPGRSETSAQPVTTEGDDWQGAVAGRAR